VLPLFVKYILLIRLIIIDVNCILKDFIKKRGSSEGILWDLLNYTEVRKHHATALKRRVFQASVRGGSK